MSQDVNITPHFINRLIARSKLIVIREDGISLGGHLVEFPTPLSPMQFKPGWLFDRLIWGDRCFRFFRQECLREAFKDIQAKRLVYWKTAYHQNLEQLLDVSSKFDQYIQNFNRYIRSSHKEEWLSRLQEPKALLVLIPEYRVLDLNVDAIKPQFVAFLDNPDKFVANRNAEFLQRQLESSKDLFDSLETHPLTPRQCDACINDEDNVLVIAGAGTGKTSTMYAKAAYLVQNGYARPEEILMLAFGKDARRELEQRVFQLDYLKGTVIRTFHALGKEIVGNYRKRATQVSVLSTDEKQYVKFIDKQIEAMMTETSLSASLKTFFSNYLYPKPNELDFKSHGQYLKYVRDNDIRDLAGNAVKSFEELTISNYLYENGIRFQYEAAYPHEVSSPGRNVYTPDYYLPDLDVYIEHFGINEKGETRPGIDRARYHEDREWKIGIHRQYGTHLIQTFSYQSRQGLDKVLEEELRAYCKAKEIDLDDILAPVSNSSMFAALKELGIYKEFSKLIAVFLGLFKASPYRLDDIQDMGKDGYERHRYKLFLNIFSWIYERYMSLLEANHTMDFSDMIRDAIQAVKQDDFHERTEFRYRFKYIMVDEFQDISPVRADLVKALREVGNQCALFCVGDDWQAIYRFAGSDVALTTDFSAHFGVTNTIYLDKTFRFNDRIEEVASGFVQENPHQLRKTLVTQARSNKTEVHVVFGKAESACCDLLARIASESAKGTSVLVLSRFKLTYKRIDHLKGLFPSLDIKAMTVHASKGKQADYVILLDVNDGPYGFPSKIITDPILEYLLPHLESFAYAEERRLFYVALTRAKKRVYIQAEVGRESEFLQEIKEGGLDVEFEPTHLNQFVIDSARCPECGAGRLIPIEGQYGLFYICSLGKKYCDTRVPACPKCGLAPLQRDEARYFCANPNCDYEAERCPSCGTGRLVIRESRNGSKFLGCSNYKGGDESSCKYTRKLGRNSKSHVG